MADWTLYTTPTFLLDYHDAVDLSLADHVYVTIKQGARVVTKQDDELTIENGKIAVFLSQQDSARFTAGEASIMANWTYSDGRRGALKETTITLDRNLLPQIL